MVASDRALATSYRLSIVTMSPSAAVWQLAAIFSGMFQAISGHISKTVRDKTKVAIDH